MHKRVTLQLSLRYYFTEQTYFPLLANSIDSHIVFDFFRKSDRCRMEVGVEIRRGEGREEVREQVGLRKDLRFLDF